MKLVSLVASTRPGSINCALYSKVAHKLESCGHTLEEMPYAQVENLPQYTPVREETSGLPPFIGTLSRSILQADGLVIASPEYNFSIPGPLKNAIDWVSRIKPYVMTGKPVLLMSASGSPVGGWRGLAALRIPLGCLGARVFPWEITAGAVASVEAVEVLSKTEAFRDRIDLAVSQFG
ncbi:NADPH-dependent FMN reductase [Pseudosulfitobacter pseudonitzschiae]|uniref:NADPH-dependent FMN reductase n=1 Tax=Pseudosulfitobacter pseudonitzschiae TaxID=1402135 RepID=UPI001AF1E718|nr:NAD(P)H-dependent oxidoreductase [Pseudosulfitobacter pseudonitzschiae]MBM1816364.1 NAD(P)H-dependent oxidoreductase [Pseudosulfitobacter pseudonitzschiae]MBM1832962.1 NAD(P)H-dependent oxidoreductase [Pseudosulfitobacter pseudonitzschiae]MBM1837830.1 NAD(P)H-dependent oxidoreductase [Pseudosulfitobacter pseudonitzschiae]MBM1843091.1 NAD(P)H-dependent oxidoreductase [Pseudosulfitobacter pseudonitzschiae]MBM1847957.1 NAD(P)H-dependent oxidoreductase [Pseudosulfitobacter pseudonitzschiae]